MHQPRGFWACASRAALSTSAAFLLSLLLGLRLLLFVLSRIHMLHLLYLAQTQKREDERWLLQQ